MMRKIKQEKGISMTSLVLTVIILLILTNTLIFNAQDSIYINRLSNLYNDIELLRAKVSEYYNEYGSIPAKIKYTNISSELSKVLSTQDKKEEFYVIDLEAMQGITLNYGKDYENVKTVTDQDKINNYTDLYIINKNSHNIFFVNGITVKEKDGTRTYYTDYTEPDETKIDLRYVDGILIPDGYYYIGKTKDNSIVISTTQEDTVDTDNTNQYVWTKQISKLEKKPDNVELNIDQKEYEFIKSVNTYGGYFINLEEKEKEKARVQYVVIDEEKWSETYKKEIEYKDRNGDKITIPQGYSISMAPTMNTVENGFVIRDSNKNEWTWVEVPKEIYGDGVTEASDYEGIYNALNTYASTYREGSLRQGRYWKDEWYYYVDSSTTLYGFVETEIKNEKEYENAVTDGELYINRAGIEATKGRYDSSKTYYKKNEALTEEQKTNTTRNSGMSLNDYTKNYKKMLSSIYTNGGFWISRYEVGIEEKNTNMAVSQANRIPYNWVTCSEAQKLASAMSKDSTDSTDSTKTSSLLFGIQWDLVCKYVETKTNLTTDDIKKDSTNWGNYKNSSIKLTKGKYNTSPNSSNSKWLNITSDAIKTPMLLTTGASEDANKMNIYDFAGNEYEWTLEHATSDTSFPCARRGGSFYDNGSDSPVAYRDSGNTSDSADRIGFRSTLY